jgi:hypothetical protein
LGAQSAVGPRRVPSACVAPPLGYLRLTGDRGKILKGQIALTATRPTKPVISNNVISLKAGINGTYVTAEDAGASALIANRTAIGSYEKFTLITG